MTISASDTECRLPTNLCSLALGQGRPWRARSGGCFCSAATRSLPQAKKGGRGVSPQRVPLPQHPLPHQVLPRPSLEVRPCSQGNTFLDSFPEVGIGGRMSSSEECTQRYLFIKRCLLDQRRLKPERVRSGPGANIPSLLTALCATPLLGFADAGVPTIPHPQSVVLRPSSRQSSRAQRRPVLASPQPRAPLSPERAGAGRLTWRRR